MLLIREDLRKMVVKNGQRLREADTMLPTVRTFLSTIPREPDRHLSVHQALILTGLKASVLNIAVRLVRRRPLYRKGEKTVFNIAKNRFRLIAFVSFRTGIVYIKEILSHKEYDKGRWKQ